eukprot:144782-Pelagomonas_calceolata.AAC.1
MHPHATPLCNSTIMQPHGSTTLCVLMRLLSATHQSCNLMAARHHASSCDSSLQLNHHATSWQHGIMRPHATPPCNSSAMQPHGSTASCVLMRLLSATHQSCNLMAARHHASSWGTYLQLISLATS